jgi:hypothetical protein
MTWSDAPDVSCSAPDTGPSLCIAPVQLTNRTGFDTVIGCPVGELE